MKRRTIQRFNVIKINRVIMLLLLLPVYSNKAVQTQIIIIISSNVLLWEILCLLARIQLYMFSQSTTIYHSQTLSSQTKISYLSLLSSRRIKWASFCLSIWRHKREIEKGGNHDEDIRKLSLYSVLPQSIEWFFFSSKQFILNLLLLKTQFNRYTPGSSDRLICSLLL